jgi:hypothetical protein
MIYGWLELQGLISDASARLHQVRQRLSSLEEGHAAITSTLQLGPIPALRLAALRSRVSDESEIGAAVNDLRGALARHLPDLGGQGPEVVMAYDGVADPESIWISVGVPAKDAGLPDGLDLLTLAGAERGATVRYDTAPRSVGDAWISLDARLEQLGLRTRGVYRQTVTAVGEVVCKHPWWPCRSRTSSRVAALTGAVPGQRPADRRGTAAPPSGDRTNGLTGRPPYRILLPLGARVPP